VERLIKWDTDEIAKIHFVSKKHGLFHRNSEGYYYIDTRTYDVVRYEVSAFIPKINLLVIKFYDVRLHATENYARKRSFAPMANTTLSITYSAANPYSKKLDTLRFYEKIYNTGLTAWKDTLVFKPTDLRAKNGQLSHGYGNIKWKDTVKFSGFERETLEGPGGSWCFSIKPFSRRFMIFSANLFIIEETKGKPGGSFIKFQNFSR
jgi:hypothetical protein